MQGVATIIALIHHFFGKYSLHVRIFSHCAEKERERPCRSFFQPVASSLKTECTLKWWSAMVNTYLYAFSKNYWANAMSINKYLSSWYFLLWVLTPLLLINPTHLHLCLFGFKLWISSTSCKFTDALGRVIKVLSFLRTYRKAQVKFFCKCQLCVCLK